MGLHHHRARLYRCGRDTTEPERATDDDRRLSDRLRDLRRAVDNSERHVARHAGVDEGRTVDDGGACVDDGRTADEIEIDERRGVVGFGRGPGQNHGHGLSYVAHRPDGDQRHRGLDGAA